MEHEGHQTGRCFGRRDSLPKAFGFQRRNKALGQGVVIRVAGAAHAGGDAMGLELLAKRRAGVLDPTVRVMNKAGEWTLLLGSTIESRNSSVRQPCLPGSDEPGSAGSRHQA